MVTKPFPILRAAAYLVLVLVAGGTEATRAPQPPAEPPTVDPGLPRALIIGDSISLGYTAPVRELLAGKVNVFRIPGNGSSSGYGLENLERWLGSGKWDAIHFNFGLHDAKLPPEGVRHADVDVYERNLRRIVARLRSTGARLVWATSTPIPLGGSLRPTRRFADIDSYNVAALRVMRENGVAVVDLNAVIAPRAGELGVPRDVHFTAAGYRLLAESVAVSIQAAVSPPTGLWDVPELQRAPTVEWSVKNGALQELLYQGEPFRGKPTRVFAFLGRPSGLGRHPAVVLVHGGGGAAFPAWAEHWAARGYVALAMDLQGNGAGRVRLPDGGPPLNSERVFVAADDDAALRESWVYHAVSSAIRGISLLAALPEVDPQRIAVTGISWGGFTTCLVASLDHRVRAAVPVYGCGFLQENSAWKEKNLDPMPPERRERWLRSFDPSRFLPRVGCPILFFTGTNDAHYPLDSHRRSALEVAPDLRHVCLRDGIRHGHIWTFGEVDRFIDRALKGEPISTRLALAPHDGESVSAVADSQMSGAKYELHVAVAEGAWTERKWTTLPAAMEGGRLTARLPSERPLVYFFSVTGADGLQATSVYGEAH